jgi:hypothetical protein
MLLNYINGTVGNPNRKPHRNIPRKKLTFPLQQGGPLPSTARVKNRNTIWRDQIKMEFCCPLCWPMVSNGLLSYLHPHWRRSSFSNIWGRGNHGKKGWWDNGKWVTTQMLWGGWRGRGYWTGRCYAWAIWVENAAQDSTIKFGSLEGPIQRYSLILIFVF